MSGLRGGQSQFRGDDGSADPRAAAALAAFAAGSGSEHAALMALAGSRLLVPVLAARAAQSADMALPTLIGADGRSAVPAFTCLDALTRWRPDARPVPTQAGLVWRAAVAESCAVVIDVAGPVPLAVEGARLRALARGEAAPLPHEDPDILDAVAAAVAEHRPDARISVGPGEDAGDLVLQLTLAVSGDAAGELAALIGASLQARLGGRLRRGVAIAIGPPAADRAARRRPA